MSRHLDVVVLTGAEYDAILAERDRLAEELEELEAVRGMRPSEYRDHYRELYERQKELGADAEATVGRLREENALLQDVHDLSESRRHEIDRLRAALEDIAAAYSEHPASQFAREALAGASDSQQRADISDGEA